MSLNIYKSIIFFILVFFTLNSCGKIGGVDAKKFPADPKQRVKNNIEQGKGFRLADKLKGKVEIQTLSLLAQMNYGELH